MSDPILVALENAQEMLAFMRNAVRNDELSIAGSETHAPKVAMLLSEVGFQVTAALAEVEKCRAYAKDTETILDCLQRRYSSERALMTTLGRITDERDRARKALGIIERSAPSPGCECVRVAREAKAAQSSRPPDGWVTVPPEPTPEMYDAVLALNAWPEELSLDEIYKAMIGAAKEAPNAE